MPSWAAHTDTRVCDGEHIVRVCTVCKQRGGCMHACGRLCKGVRGVQTAVGRKPLCVCLAYISCHVSLHMSMIVVGAAGAATAAVSATLCWHTKNK